MLHFFIIFLVTLSPASNLDKAYFEQFLYKQVISQPDPDFPAIITYRYISDRLGNGGVYIPTDDGRYIGTDAQLLLLEDNTYKLIYTESLYDSPSDIVSWEMECREITGLWDVPAENLEIYNSSGELIAIGERSIFESQESVKLILQQKIISEEAAHSFFNLSEAVTNESFNQIGCLGLKNLERSVTRD